MGLPKHGLTHWDPRSTGLANELIDHWQVHKKLPPHLAYILWNCSGVDVNNLEAILVMTWHRQGAFKYSMEYFRWIPTKWSRLNKMYQTPVKRSSWLDYFISPLVPYICVGEFGQHWFGQWFLACSVPSHFLNQCWLIINWTLGNKLQWNCNWNSNTFIEDRFENDVCNFHIINGILYSCLIGIWSKDV